MNNSPVRGKALVKFQTLTITSIIFIGLILSFAAFRTIYRAESATIEKEFLGEMDRRVQSFEREIVLNFEVLQGIRNLFDGSVSVSWEEFTEVAVRTINRHPDIKALEWVPRVKLSEREEFERSLRKRIPGFRISDQNSQGVTKTAGDRDEYFPVSYLVPLTGNEAALGFDIGFDDFRNMFLRKAAEENQITVTSGFTLMQDSSDQKGILVILPVYYKDVESGEAWNTVRGFLISAIRPSDIFQSATLENEPAGIEMKLTDMTDIGNELLLYHHESRTGEPSADSISYSRMLRDIGGRKWLVSAVPTKGYLQNQRSRSAFISLVAGLGFTAMSALLISMLSRRSLLIEQEVNNRTSELKAANKLLGRLSNTDGLTELANRRAFDSHFEHEWLRAARNRSMITVIMADIDHFKEYNDRYGHQAGDECLRKVAGALKASLSRPADFVARFGGEEFSILLPETDKNASVLAERCRENVENLKILHKSSRISDYVTVSLGLSTCRPSMESLPEMLLKSADDALYSAKKGGRNRIEVYPSTC